MRAPTSSVLPMMPSGLLPSTGVDIGACDADFGGTAGGLEFKTVGAFECGEAGDV
jgi:hypothetical protein